MTKIQKEIKTSIIGRWDYISKLDTLKELKNIYKISDILVGYNNIEWDYGTIT